MLLKSDLSGEDRHFFSEPSSWKFGPTYDTAIFVDGNTRPDEIARTALEFRDLTIWEGNPESHPFKTILKPHGCPCVGLFHLCSARVHRSILKYVLAIYPSQFNRAVGSKIGDAWESMNRTQLTSLHAALIDLIRHINFKIPILSATISNEDYGNFKASGTDGSIYLESALAKEIGIAAVELSPPNDHFSVVRIG